MELADWAGGVHRIDYGPNDGGWWMTGPDGLARTTLQDRAGFPASVEATIGGQALWRTAYTHDAEDRLAERWDSRLGDTRFDYDAEGQLLGFTRASGRAERYAYDGAGHRVGGPAGGATFDVCNRILSDGGTRFAHAPRGAIVERVGPNGHWHFRPDGFGRLVEAQDAHGRTHRFGCDPLGRRIWMRAEDAEGITLTRFHYAGEQMIAEEVTQERPDATAATVGRAYGYARWDGRPSSCANAA